MRKGVSVCYSWGMSEIEDRRQRALEAVHDSARSITTLPAESDPVKVGIEVATQVRITRDIIDAAKAVPFTSDKEALTRAFRAAGFEVIR